MIIDVIDAHLWYDVAGPSDAPAIIFLHGFPHDHRLWEAQRDALARRYRVITTDLRGFGASSTNGPYSMDRYADDVAAVLSAATVDRATVCGLSMGGYIAFALWRRHAERVAGLVFVDTKATADDDAIRSRRRELIELARTESADAVANTQIIGAVGAQTRRQRPELVEQLHAMMAEAPVDGIVGALTAMLERPDSTATLGTITVPTLVIGGDEDVITPLKTTRALSEALPGSTFRVITGAGHLSNVEQPTQFNDAIVRFLETI